MPVIGDDLLVLAEQLARQPGEAAHRAAISRAYCALYHTSLTPAQRRLRERFKQRHGPHDSLWEYLNNLRTTEAMQLSQGGKDLLVKRIIADYDITARIAQAQAIGAVGNARSLINLAGQLR